MNILEAINVTKQYAGHRALDGVSIAVPENSIYGLLGPNGAGKTTLIRIINQITAPDSGEVLLNGSPLKPSDIEAIGYLPEERGLYKKMSVAEQVIYLAQLKGLKKSVAKERMKYWLDKFEISDWADKKIMELSKGMQQKVQFITTVLHEPKLLIFDEPFSGFDPVNAELMKKEILELRDNGATLILSTHNMNSVEELCQEITLINSSKAVLQGSVAQIRQDYKKNLYRVHLTDEAISSTTDMYSVVSERKVQGGVEAILQKKQELSNKDFIQILAKDYELVAFEEQLPSMQEVFIETIQNTSIKK